MWIGIGLIAAGFIMGGGWILYRINKEVKGMDNDG